MGVVKGLLSMYVPPDPQKMEQSLSGRKSILKSPRPLLELVFRDYAQPGDQMGL